MMNRIIKTTAILALVLSLSACGKKVEEARSIDQIHSEMGIPVRVTELKRTTFEQALRYNATLGGIEESTSQAMVGDVITAINAKVGDRVNKGDIIVSFPRNTPAAQYEQAQSAFSSISVVHDRMQRLQQQGAISLQDYENVKTQWEVSKANLEASEQMIHVRAPISGIVTNIMVSVAERVYPGKELFTVASTNGYKAVLMVPESEVAQVKKGAAVSATWNDISINGRISSIGMALDPGSKAFRVEAIFTGLRKDLNYGVTAEINIITQSKKNVMVVDRHHLVRENGGYFVWVADGGIAVRRAVQVGLTDQLRYEITEGLEEGDLLITEGIKSLSDNIKIRVIEGN